jgi:hypothetical protein
MSGNVRDSDLLGSRCTGLNGLYVVAGLQTGHPEELRTTPSTPTGRSKDRPLPVTPASSRPGSHPSIRPQDAGASKESTPRNRNVGAPTLLCEVRA